MAGVLDYRRYLSENEADLIIQRFSGGDFVPNGQVLWSGMHREEAQTWGNHHGLQTLTSAMGPLMDPEHLMFAKKLKSDAQWSQYVKGASILFAQHIARGERVVVLCRPPPEKFHPSGITNYQALEEPVLKACIGMNSQFVLEMCHPMVPGAENYCYEVWPTDKTTKWVKRFGSAVDENHKWREVKLKAIRSLQGQSPLKGPSSSQMGGLSNASRQEAGNSGLRPLDEAKGKTGRQTTVEYALSFAFQSAIVLHLALGFGILRILGRLGDAWLTGSRDLLLSRLTCTLRWVFDVLEEPFSVLEGITRSLKKRLRTPEELALENVEASKEGQQNLQDDAETVLADCGAIEARNALKKANQGANVAEQRAGEAEKQLKAASQRIVLAEKCLNEAEARVQKLENRVNEGKKLWLEDEKKKKAKSGKVPEQRKDTPPASSATGNLQEQSVSKKKTLCAESIKSSGQASEKQLGKSPKQTVAPKTSSAAEQAGRSMETKKKKKKKKKKKLLKDKAA